MKTVHRIWFCDARQMDCIPSGSVDLVVTSPPYPMIEMWDGMFAGQDQAVAAALEAEDGRAAFELMHQQLDPVWDECFRVLKQGGLACVNIGDATRTVDGDFQLYSNHSRILERLRAAGFSALPDILWRKQTNAPNKFMGSGMLPAGAYVTLEHEYILVVRKGRKRVFKTAEEKRLRRESAFFWEERNTWFSDVWTDIKGTGQGLQDKAARDRSAAFPFEVAYRLISMFSAKGDTVLDPFVGTGTTLLAAMVSARNGIGMEIDSTLGDTIGRAAQDLVPFAKQYVQERVERHLAFVRERIASRGRGALKYTNEHYGFPVMTRQEREILFNELVSVTRVGDGMSEAVYADGPPAESCRDWDREWTEPNEPDPATTQGKRHKGRRPNGGQP